MAERAEKPWYPLDNAGVLYSSLQNENYSAIYRFSAVMNAPVDPAALQRAIDRCMPRFPVFAVRIRRGLFWYYLEPNTAPGPYLRPDVADPCQPLRFGEDNGWLVRFYYDRTRISLEVFHAISDGAGAIVFFRSLLAEYLRQLGHDIPSREDAAAADRVLDPDRPPDPEEQEDAYLRYAGKVKHKRQLLPKAYQNIGIPEPFYTFHVTMGFCPLDLLKQKAKEKGSSVTEYLTAVMLWVILEKQREEKPFRLLPVALAIPVNLRGLFPSRTLRNFITTLRVAIDPNLGEYTFDQVLGQVHHFLRLHATPQDLRATFTGNVLFQSNRLLSVFPVFLKTPIVALSYQLQGTRPYSGTYTNPGAFAVPPQMEPHIHHVEVILGQATRPRSHCASISYQNTMEITFGGTQVDSETERRFFHFLVEQGIPVTVQSNRRETPPPAKEELQWPIV